MKYTPQTATIQSELQLFQPVEPMKRILLKSKIHRATVTEAQLHYEGSVTIDSELMAAADIVEFEQVQIYDVTSGSRLTTYAIAGTPDSGVICINGAAAHLVQPGDVVIIASYAEYDAAEVDRHAPKLIKVDESNRIVEAPATATAVPEC